MLGKQHLTNLTQSGEIGSVLTSRHGSLPDLDRSAAFISPPASRGTCTHLTPECKEFVGKRRDGFHHFPPFHLSQTLTDWIKQA